MIKLPEAAFKQGAVTVQIGDTFSTVETKTVIVVINLYTEKQLKQVVRDALEAGYLAGFNQSAEGFNGEYPFSDSGRKPDENAAWVKLRDETIRQLKEGL